MNREDEPETPLEGEIAEQGDASFLATAISHGLLLADRAEQAREYAKENRVTELDAVLALSLMKAAKVEAVQLLGRPKACVPGYELVELIGWGVSGNVFKANQIALQRPVALKTIKNEAPSTFESRMQREAEAIARLKHPNIVVAYESGFAHGRFYIAMELIEGGTLFDFIVRHSPVNEVVTWQIIRQAAAALSHANDAGIIHRDIKPANILLAAAPAGSKLPTNVPFVKVADFGLARDFKSLKDARITAEGVTLGTPAYVAPEQLDDTAVDCRADIYALGATAFHLLSGTMPCAGQSPMRAILDKSTGKDAWREQLPESISETSTILFRDMTEKEPDERVANYDELIGRIDELLSTGDETLDTTDMMPQFQKRRRSKNSSRWNFLSLRMATGAAILAIGLGVLAWRFGLVDQSVEPNTPLIVSSGHGNWQPKGPPEPLFNGTSVPFRLVKGIWNPDATGDGSLVLHGLEHSRLHLPLLASESTTGNARLRLSVAPAAESGAVDVSFELSNEQAAAKQLAGKVRITEGEAVLLDASDQPVSPEERTLRFSDSVDSQMPFRRVQVDRLGDVLLVLVNGHLVGDWQVESDASITTVVNCASGDAQVADIDIVELTDVAKTNATL